MRVTILLLAALSAAVAGEPILDVAERIVGGSIPALSQYPFAAAVARAQGGAVIQTCGGSIINNRSVLTAASCLINRVASEMRIRVGSINASSGGTVHLAAQLISHPGHVLSTGVDNIAILRTATTIVFLANTVEPASIAGPNYVLHDNQPVWAIGWGEIIAGGPWSEQLRHVQLWSISQAECRQPVGIAVADSMLCAGWLQPGGRGQCSGDAGGPLLHSGVIVGVFFSDLQCGVGQWPGLHTRVSNYTAWILNNA